ncbi:MAG: 16S rRNA (guanine(527)-N(7))-methyltransferase RsmG [Actinomycetaceae bacterium]|nr:16S rRNA (guanine(527)-N(7))-methyltransferase RsmG [Actinomycetaceae bacterium]
MAHIARRFSSLQTLGNLDKPEGICATGDCDKKNPESAAELKDHRSEEDALVNVNNAEQALVEPELATEAVKEYFGFAYGALEVYADLLFDEGELRGVVGPRELGRLWSRHIVNCAALLDYLPESGTVADVGSGAGLPGIVIAVMRPDLDVHLIETMERRCAWLNDVIEALDLDNVTVHQGRVEDMPKKFRVDAVTARAVANLRKLVLWTSGIIRPGGRLLALKGERVYLEVEDAQDVLRKKRMGAVKVHEVPSIMDDGVTFVAESQKSRNSR